MIPELTVSNITQSRNFYISALGFHLEYERPDDKFLFVSYGSSQLMLEELHEDGWNTGALDFPFGRGINFSIACNDIDTLYQRVLTQEIVPYRELHKAVYMCDGNEIQQTQFLIQDPDGYLLRFTD